MKKIYSAPIAQSITLTVEGMFAASDPSQFHEEYSESEQLSNKNTGWNSGSWANEED